MGKEECCSSIQKHKIHQYMIPHGTASSPPTILVLFSDALSGLLAFFSSLRPHTQPPSFTPAGVTPPWNSTRFLTAVFLALPSSANHVCVPRSTLLHERKELPGSVRPRRVLNLRPTTNLLPWMNPPAALALVAVTSPPCGQIRKWTQQTLMHRIILYVLLYYCLMMTHFDEE